MKKICALVLFLGLLIIPLPSFALTLNGDGTSPVWIQSESTPAQFNSMRLFWGINNGADGGVINYDLYRPAGYSGNQEFDPFAIDLSSFQGENVTFKFYATGNDSDNAITLTENARVLGDSYLTDGKPDYWESNYPFYFGFYSTPATGDLSEKWYNRELIAYVPGIILNPDPSSFGSLLFHYSAEIPSSIIGQDVSSDFIQSPVPVPGALWLLGSGLIGLAGIRRKFKR